MIDLNVIAAVEIGIKPRTLAHLIEVERRQILAEISDADCDGQLAANLFWPTIRSLRSIGAQPILTVEQEAVLPALDAEAFHRWRAGEQSARRAWLNISWEPAAAHSVRKGNSSP